MSVERKQLYRFILEAFRSNEDAERFLRDQPDYGDKLANAVPSPRVDREEFSFELADRLGRWGYTEDFLVALMQDSEVRIAARRRAAELLGRDGGEVVDKASGQDGGAQGQTQAEPKHPTAVEPKPPTVVTQPPQTVPTQATPQSVPPNKGDDEDAEQTERWLLYLENPSFANGWEIGLIRELNTTHRCASKNPKRIDINFQPISMEITRGSAENLARKFWEQQEQGITNKLLGCRVLAWHHEASEGGLLDILHREQGNSVWLSWEGGFSSLKSGAIPDIRTYGNNAISSKVLAAELDWYFQEHPLKFCRATDTARADDAMALLASWREAAINAIAGAGELGSLWFSRCRGLLIPYSPKSPPAWPWEVLKRHVVRKPSDKLSINLGAAQSQPDARALKILLVCPRAYSDPKEIGYRHVSEVLLDLIHSRGLGATVYELNPATVDALQELGLTDREFDILHFDGHGGTGTLEFESDDASGMRIAIDVAEIADDLQDLGIQVAVLTACSSARPGAHGLPSSAETLSAAVGEAVGMRWELHKDGARAFLTGFYTGLLRFNKRRVVRSMARAVRRGRVYMGTSPQRTRETDSVRLKDGILPQHFIERAAVLPPMLTVTPTTPRFPSDWPQTARPSPKNPEGYYGFVGRNAELHALMRWWASTSQVKLLTGAPGCGKTLLLKWWVVRLFRTGQLDADAVLVARGLPTTSTSTPAAQRVIFVDADCGCRNVSEFLQYVWGQVADPGEALPDNSHAALADRLPKRSTLIWDPTPDTIDDQMLDALCQLGPELSRCEHRLVVTRGPEINQHTQSRLSVLPLSGLHEHEAVELLRNIAEQRNETITLPLVLNQPDGNLNHAFTYLPRTIVASAASIVDPREGGRAWSSARLRGLAVTASGRSEAATTVAPGG